MRIIERTVYKQGESLQLLLNDGVRLPFKASLVESTKASNSLNNRANGIQGQSFNRTTDASETPIRSGMYFERECDPDNAYLIISSIPEPKYPRLMFLYALRCNERDVYKRQARMRETSLERMKTACTHSINLWLLIRPLCRMTQSILESMPKQRTPKS